jgi:hypothetical protein
VLPRGCRGRPGLHYSGGMRALCPSCGLHHEVVRVLEEGFGDQHKDVYQIAPLEECTRTWMTDQDLLEARARFDQEAIIQDEDEA